MLDWLTWPADFLLNTAAVLASWFVDKGSWNFVTIQMAFAVLLLAIVVALIAYWQWLVQWVAESWRSILGKKRGTSHIDLNE
jgi:hypothetical protein